MSKQKIFSVVTKAGVVTRTSATKDYTHAIIVDQWPVTWCSRYDLAVKALKQYEGGEIQEAIQLDKAPVDPYKNVTIVYGYAKGFMLSGTVVIDNQITYFRNNGVWCEIPGDEAELGTPITGYLERLAIMYKLNTWRGNNGKK